MSSIKKIFIVLFAVMAVILMQTSVFAKTGKGTKDDPYIVTDYLEIVACVKENCYIKLGSDIKYNGNPLYVNGTDVHIDLNGSTLEDLTVTRAGFRSNQTIIIMGNGKLTIDDSSGGDGKLISNKNNALIEVGYTDSENKDNKLTVNGGSIINNNTGRQSDTDQYVSHAIFVYNGAVEVNDGLIYSKNSNALYVAGKTAVINGGTFKSDASDKYGIDVYYNQNVEINGGDIYGLNFLFTVASQLNNLKIKVNECNIYKKFRTGQGSLANFLAPDSSATINGEPADTSRGTFILTSPMVIKAPHFNISFNANGGKGSMDSASIIQGASFVLPECGFTPSEEKYEFAGWQADGKTYTPGDSVEITKDTEFRAVWNRKCAVQFFDNWSSESSVVYITPNEQLALPYCTFTPPANTGFYKWQSNGVLYDVGDEITITKDTKIYATWYVKKVRKIVKEPVIGETPVNSAKNATENIGGEAVEFVDYSLVNSAHFGLESVQTEPFEIGKAYTFTIHLLANSDPYYYTDDTVYYINDNIAKLDKEKSSTKSAFITYTFPMLMYAQIPFDKENSTYAVNGTIKFDKDVLDDVLSAICENSDAAMMAYFADDWCYEWYADGELVYTSQDIKDISFTVPYDCSGKTIYAVLVCADQNAKSEEVSIPAFYYKGDIDHDGYVTDKDAVYLLKYLSGTYDLTESQKAAARVTDGDTDINILDVIAILNNASQK